MLQFTLELERSVRGMFWARPVHLEPVVYTGLVVDAQTRQSRNGLAGLHILQADHALALVLAQNVLVISNPRLGEAHNKVDVDLVVDYQL